MAEGNKTFMGLAVPLYGESEIQQQTLATDILTVTGISGQTGDFLVCQNSSGTEVFVVDASGNVTAAGTLVGTGNQTAAGTLYVSGNATIKGTLSQSGAATLGSTAVLSGNVTHSGTSLLSGNVTNSGTTILSGNATLGGTLVMSGSSSFNSAIAKMVIGTIALASIASNATATAALTGLPAAGVVAIFPRSAIGAASGVPYVWSAGADSLGYGGMGINCSSQTVNVWYFATA